MDPRLAEIYGTNEDTSDTEKLAAAELAESLADDDDVDIDGMSDEEIEALAQEVLSSEEGDEDDEEYDEDTEKIAEADYLGRVMAHAYVNELKGIDYDSQEKLAAKAAARRVAKAVVRKAKKAGPGAMTRLYRRLKSRVGALREAGSLKARRLKKKLKVMGGEAKAYAKRHGKAMAGAGLVGLGGGIAAGRMSKQSSALDTLAAERAMEILEENGALVDSEADLLAQAVEERALEMLEAEGYSFE
jgi:hypothetical protein